MQISHVWRARIATCIRHRPPGNSRNCTSGRYESCSPRPGPPHFLLERELAHARAGTLHARLIARPLANEPPSAAAITVGLQRWGPGRSTLMEVDMLKAIVAASLLTVSGVACAHESDPIMDESPALAAMRYCQVVGVRAAWGAQARFLGAPAV